MQQIKHAGHRRPFTQGPPKPPAKVVPFPGLLIFAANGINFREAKDCLAKHCLASYGIDSILLPLAAESFVRHLQPDKFPLTTRNVQRRIEAR
jgi:hypothetical protein